MPFAGTWMDLEITIQSEANQRQISYGIVYMQNIKNDTNELIYKTEIDSQTQKTNLRLSKGKEEGIHQEFGINMHTLVYISKQQGSTLWHRELYSR